MSDDSEKPSPLDLWEKYQWCRNADLGRDLPPELLEYLDSVAEKLVGPMHRRPVVSSQLTMNYKAQAANALGLRPTDSNKSMIAMRLKAERNKQIKWAWLEFQKHLKGPNVNQDYCPDFDAVSIGRPSQSFRLNTKDDFLEWASIAFELSSETIEKMIREGFS